jgi:hypothetical protein
VKTETTTTLPDLSKVPRRDIRYVLICLQNQTDVVKPEHQELVPAIRKFMADNGRKLEDFGGKWDIGIDTIDTMHMRPECWWLWGIAHTVIVDRPDKSRDIPAGMDRIFGAGFGAKGRMPPFTRADYEAIAAGSADRKGWL